MGMNWLPVYTGLGIGAALLVLGIATGRWLKTQREIRERLGERPVPVEEVVARSLGRRDWLVDGARVIHDGEGLGRVLRALSTGAGAYIVFDSGVRRLMAAHELDPVKAAAGIPNQHPRKD